jgi:hypothetical protein
MIDEKAQETALSMNSKPDNPELITSVNNYYSSHKDFPCDAYSRLEAALASDDDLLTALSGIPNNPNIAVNAILLYQMVFLPQASLDIPPAFPHHPKSSNSIRGQ